MERAADECERENGPLHDGEQVMDSRYSDGTWDTLVLLEGDSLLLLGASLPTMQLSREDGPVTVQGGMYLMSRGATTDFRMTIGGGD